MDRPTALLYKCDESPCKHKVNLLWSVKQDHPHKITQSQNMALSRSAQQGEPTYYLGQREGETKFLLGSTRLLIT